MLQHARTYVRPCLKLSIVSEATKVSIWRTTNAFVKINRYEIHLRFAAVVREMKRIQHFRLPTSVWILKQRSDISCGDWYIRTAGLYNAYAMAMLVDIGLSPQWHVSAISIFSTGLWAGRKPSWFCPCQLTAWRHNGPQSLVFSAGGTHSILCNIPWLTIFEFMCVCRRDAHYCRLLKYH
jgi:hypothetical protein